MALIDVSDLMLDPDFVDPLSLVHRTALVNAYGETLLTETVTETIGSIQPASTKELQRVPEALRQRDIRSFYIKAEILTDGSDTYPDLIEFKGKRFQVISSEQWLNYGQGYNRGLAIAEVISS